MSKLPKRINVAIGSVIPDLPLHRQAVVEACVRQGMYPLMIEHLPANADEAVSAALRLADAADIYVGIFAHQYGYSPLGYDISIPEMEYNAAIKRGLPRLIFLMQDIEPGPGKEKDTERIRFEAFAERLKSEQTVHFFNSPEDLRTQLINALALHRKADITTLHYVSEIPKPPEPYTAHPYTLLLTNNFSGRKTELTLLSDWVAKSNSPLYSKAILNVIAIGGMGKSALTWKWFNEIASEKIKPLTGKIWWSFYESDARFENFIIRALAYTTGMSSDEIIQIPAFLREEKLLNILDEQPFLIVMDGLERILNAYAQMNAVYMRDDEVADDTSYPVTKIDPSNPAFALLPPIVSSANTRSSAWSAALSSETLQQRKAADPRIGRFLRYLARVKASRILISSRLYPADLQDRLTQEPVAGSTALFLEGLTDDDALSLWHGSNQTGTGETLIPIFNSFENHPLVIQALAGEVKNYPSAPDNLSQWLIDHESFNPSHTSRLQEAMAHVTEFAMRGLSDPAFRVMQTIAAFRMPANYDNLAALLVGPEHVFATDAELIGMLAELENRGLLGWDRRANRYDLHPIVRSATWSRLDAGAKYNVYTALHTHFEAIPKPLWQQVNTLDELTPTIELFNTLIGLNRHHEALALFARRLSKAMLHRLGTSRPCIELLRCFYPSDTDQPLISPNDQLFALNSLAIAYQISGEVAPALRLHQQQITLASWVKARKDVLTGSINLVTVLLTTGELYNAELEARRAFLLSQNQHGEGKQAIGLQYLGLILAARGNHEESLKALRVALYTYVGESQPEGVIYATFAQRGLWFSDYAVALERASRAWNLANVMGNERDVVRAMRLQGSAALGNRQLTTASDLLYQALIRARAIQFVEEELPILIALAELNFQQDNFRTAHELLDDVWELAERGGYRLLQADALNVLAEIEYAEGHLELAVKAASEAFEKSWCDGPPYTYYCGLKKAERQLQFFKASLPQLSVFDERKYKPMPKVDMVID